MLMKGVNERKSSSSLSECDVGLGLKMTQADSSTCERAISLPFHQYPFYTPGKDANFAYLGVGGGLGGGAAPFFFNISEGGMTLSGAALFTASQWRELERQKLIHKYMMATIPVPPELILPTSRIPSIASVPQSNTSGLESKLSSSRMDPEPWRCKRTDGKKWRCSRDVAPDQKYCERHAHKNRPRSRKPVGVASHSSTGSLSQNPLIPLQRPSSSQVPSLANSTPHDQARCIEWFMRGGSSGSDTIPVSTCSQQQWQQVMQTPSRLDLMNKDNIDHNKNVSVFETQEQQDFMSLNHPCLPKRLENHHHFRNEEFSKMTYFQGNLSVNAGATHTTRHFIDAWEKETLDGIASKGLSTSWNKKLSPSSLTLSMSALNGIDEDPENSHFEVGLMNSDRDSEGILKSQWMSPVSWAISPPGGPLGEALCLGNSNSTKGNSSLVSPHGYCHNNTISNTNSSKSSCEDDSHVLNFIG